MIESLFASTSTTSSFSWTNLTIALLSSVVLGLVVSFIYMKTHREKLHSKSFAITLVILPAIISIIILLVGSDVARAFSLAGAFSIIRFRSAPGDPKDITFVLFSLALGLACGMGYILIGVLVAVLLGVVLILLDLTKFGQLTKTPKILKITIPESLNYQAAFNELLQENTISYHLQKVKTTNLGSLYELVYHIVTDQTLDEKAFIDELRCRNGNLNITLVMNQQNVDY